MAKLIYTQTRSIFSALRKTKDALLHNLGSIFKAPVSPKSLEQLQQALFLSDVGYNTTTHLVKRVENNMQNINSSGQTLQQFLRQEMISIFKQPTLLSLQNMTTQLDSVKKPTVLFLVGVNGVGKTTTAAKLCSFYKQKGRKVILAAADTQRAAAVEQLQEWGKRSDTPVICRLPDKFGKVAPEQVIYDAVNYCFPDRSGKPVYDLIIVDTAGRLQTNRSAMNELDKMRSAAGKVKRGAPDHVWLVLDATIGQNAIEQAKAFHRHVRLNGVIVTKLDGTAKGGIVLAVSNELRLPVLYVGVGEKMEDLKPFNAEEFVDSILENENTIDEDEVHI